MHPVDDRGGRRQEVEIELAGQPLLNDLEMQETEKPAAEAKAERVTSASSTPVGFRLGCWPRSWHGQLNGRGPDRRGAPHQACQSSQRLDRNCKSPRGGFQAIVVGRQLKRSALRAQVLKGSQMQSI